VGLAGVIQIKWAFSAQGALVKIDTPGMEKGLACKCTCPSCGQPLIARLGGDRAHHFAHHNGGEALCQFALETELHIRAKHLIDERKIVALPLHLSKQDTPAFETFKITDVRVEKFHLGKKPDLIVIIDGQQYIIEIAVTHFAEDGKIQHFRQHHVSAAEFNLSKIRASDDLDNVLEKILFHPDGDAPVYWLSLSLLTPIGQKAMVKLRSEAIEIRGEIRKAQITHRELSANNWKLEKSNKELQKKIAELQQIVGLMDSLAEIKFEVVSEKQKLQKLGDLRRDPDGVNAQFLRRERELDNAEKNLTERQLHFLKQERDLAAQDKKNRRHFVEQDNIIGRQWEELIDALHSVAIIDNDFRDAGLRISDVEGIRERIANQAKYEGIHKRKIEICTAEFNKINEKKMRLEDEIAGILKNKDFYQQEIAKLHRELRDIQAK
jgi:hypothetical protein